MSAIAEAAGNLNIASERCKRLYLTNALCVLTNFH
jgi:hypothetical protein